MKRNVITLIVAAIAVSVSAGSYADSPIDGTWKSDPTRISFPKRPMTVSLKDGTYECLSCIPKYKVAADGQDQKLDRHPIFDTFAVKVIDERTVEMTGKKDGRVINQVRIEIASDGKTLTREGSWHPASGGEVSKDKVLYTRVSRSPAETGFSGAWRGTKVLSVSDTGQTVTFKTEGDRITMNTATGVSYSAKLDGSDAPVTGDPGSNGVSVKMKGKNTLVETSKRDGKPFLTQTMTVEPSGKTATVSWKNRVAGSTGSYVLVKQ